MTAGVIAIIRLRATLAPQGLFEALVRGGIRKAEITLPTPEAEQTITRWRRLAEGSELEVGAGTVRTPGGARRAAECGAQFLVTPTYSREVLDVASTSGLGVFCGAATATECDHAWHHPSVVGVKVFPAEPLGGPLYIKALKDPLDDVAFVPTGGVTLERTRQYARIGCSGVGVGGNLVSEDLVIAEQWDVIADRARVFVAAWKDGCEEGEHCG